MSSLIIFYVVFLCINKIIIFVGILCRVDMALWVLKLYWVQFLTTGINCILRRTCVVWFICVFIEVLWLWSMFLLFWMSCSLCEFLFIYNGPLKGQWSSFPSCCINNYLTPLLLIPHPIKSSFRYGIDEVLGIWKDLGW